MSQDGGTSDRPHRVEDRPRVYADWAKVAVHAYFDPQEYANRLPKTGQTSLIVDCTSVGDRVIRLTPFQFMCKRACSSATAPEGNSPQHTGSCVETTAALVLSSRTSLDA